MRKTLFMAVMGFLAAACAPEATKTEFVKGEPLEEGTYTVTEIAEQVYHLEDCNSANPKGTVLNDSGQVVSFNNCSDMYLIVGKKEALLIDLSNEIRWAENGVESLQKVVADRIGELPLTITCTHNHGDHLGMLPAFVNNPDVKFVMPKVDFQDRQDMFPASQLSLYDEGFAFDLGGKVVKTVMVPGHTHGSIVFSLEGENMLFTGDAIGSGSGVWIFSQEGLAEYCGGILHLMQWIDNPDNGIDKDKLVIYGGHYHQRSALELEDSEELGWSYLEDMDELIGQMKEGTAEATPSGQRMLDTNFHYGYATVTMNNDAYQAFKAAF